MFGILCSIFFSWNSDQWVGATTQMIFTYQSSSGRIISQSNGFTEMHQLHTSIIYFYQSILIGICTFDWLMNVINKHLEALKSWGFWESSLRQNLSSRCKSFSSLVGVIWSAVLNSSTAENANIWETRFIYVETSPGNDWSANHKSLCPERKWELYCYGCA